MGAPDAAPLKASTAEVWRRARESHPPGTRLVRYIDLEAEYQSFVAIPETRLDFMDGATVIRPAGPAEPRAWDELIAVWNARFLGITV